MDSFFPPVPTVVRKVSSTRPPREIEILLERRRERRAQRAHRRHLAAATAGLRFPPLLCPICHIPKVEHPTLASK